jgi:ABC-type phosphate transport system permease subunit
MGKRIWNLGKIAKFVYALFAMLIIVPVIMLWAKAALVGTLTVLFMVLPLIIITWITFYKHTRPLRKT